MQPSQIEETLLGMMAEEQRKALRQDLKAPRRPGFFRRSLARKAAKSPKLSSKASGGRRTDLIVAGFGIALGIGCALFPWYIFLHPDKFGVRAMKFGGSGSAQDGPIYLGSAGERVGAPMTVQDIPPMKLDLFATGTTKAPGGEGEGAQSVAEQPFPGEAEEFRLVHVANGRAMIADDAGLWVVQTGSLLPDNSKVARIEQRDGAWVLVTSTDRVIGLSAP